MTSLMDGDLDKALIYYESFNAEYNRVSQLIPEWEGYFPSGPMDDLGEALKSKDGAAIEAAIQQVGGV